VGGANSTEAKISMLHFVRYAAGLGLVATISAHVDAAMSGGGVPNFSSVDSPWVAMGTDYLPPPSGIGPITLDKSHRVMEVTPDQFGTLRRTPMRLADVNNPNLKPWVADQLKKANDELLAGKIRIGARGNCMPGGVPQFLLYAGGFENLYFIQTPNEVLMIHQADTQVRHVYMNVPHTLHPAPSWYGESVGHYQGDELVVDTIGLNDRTFLDDHYDVPHTTQSHVIERFRLTDGGRNLEVNFTVEDPGAFNAPWSAIVRYRHAREPQLLTEEPCAENNAEQLTSYIHIPTAAKPEF
jgi:hypothetical protein